MDKILISKILETSITQVSKVLQMLLDLMKYKKQKIFFGFTSSPTKEEIKKRYKELAKKYHPDINNGDDEK